MKRGFTLALLISCSAPGERDAATTGSASGEIVDRLLEDLRSDSLAIREQSMLALQDYYPDTGILPKLEAAAREDSESAARLGVLIENLSRLKSLEPERGAPVRIDLPLSVGSALELLRRISCDAGWTLDAPADDGRRIRIAIPNRSPWQAVDEVCRAHGELNARFSGTTLTITKGVYRPPILVVGPGIAFQTDGVAYRAHPVLSWTSSWTIGLSPDWCEIGVIDPGTADQRPQGYLGASTRITRDASRHVTHLLLGAAAPDHRGAFRVRIRCGFERPTRPLFSVIHPEIGKPRSPDSGMTVTVQSISPGPTMAVRLQIEDPDDLLDFERLRIVLHDRQGRPCGGEVASFVRRPQATECSVQFPEMSGRQIESLHGFSARFHIHEADSFLQVSWVTDAPLLSSDR